MHFGSVPYKTKQFFLVLIKLSIVVGAFYFIYQKLTSNEDLNIYDFLEFLKENQSFSLKTILFLFVLSIFNWFLEILKWKQLVSAFTHITFKNAMEQSLGSLTASLLTPNRIGEYGAKAVYYVSAFRKKVVLMNLLGNLMQMGTTLLFGCIGLILLDAKYDIPINYYKSFRFLGIVIIVSVFVLFGLKQTRFKVKGFSVETIIQFIKSISRHIIATGILLSILRYIVFSFQFYCLLKIFGVEVSYFNAMIVISSMYILASIIPTIFIFDVVIKSSVAVYLFSIVGVNDFTTLCIVTLMWLLNFVIPSIFGSYYVLNFNLPKHNRS